MANPDLEPNALQKPVRGSLVLERDQRKAEAKAERRDATAEAKARDGYRCRWPEAHTCRGLLEGAHIKDKSTYPELAADSGNIITLCAWIHRRGPASIHKKQLKVEAVTAAGAWAGLSFWRQTGEYDALGQPIYYEVCRESSIGIVERGEQ
jgi:hypothetical protein